MGYFGIPKIIVFGFQISLVTLLDAEFLNFFFPFLPFSENGLLIHGVVWCHFDLVWLNGED